MYEKMSAVEEEANQLYDQLEMQYLAKHKPQSKPQPVADEKEAAHRPQITFERKRPVEDFVEQRFHNGPGRN